MSGDRQTAKLAVGRPLDGIRRDFPPSSNGVEAPRLSCELQSESGKGKSMGEITRALIARVGADLAKRVIQVHAVDAAGRRVVARSLKREQFLQWCAQLPAGCLVAMEACSSAHHWARKLRALGLDARLIPAHLVAPYRMEGKTGKNDATDAAAICEAASRPSMRFVTIKSCEQQGVMSLHRVREGLKEERTSCITRIRGVLAEFGIVPSQNSTGGKASLGRITKHGDDYLRTLMIQGAKSAVMSAGKRDDPISRWLVQLVARVGWQKACVAMANKNARIVWAVMTRDRPYDARYVSAKPHAKRPPTEHVVQPQPA